MIALRFRLLEWQIIRTPTEQLAGNFVNSSAMHGIVQLFSSVTAMALLIFSENGAAMTPTSTKKGARLYRYYVSMDVIRNRETGEETGPMRLPAGMVEDAVVTEVRRILQTPEVVSQVLAALKRDEGVASEADAIAAMHEFKALWSQLFPAEQARIIQLLVRRVTVTAVGLEVDIRREGIAGVIREMIAPRRMEAAE